MTQFVKYTAQGNDYIIIDPDLFPLVIGPKIAIALCDRQNGIGADGILYGPFFEGDDVCLKIFNANGTACGRSGNGLCIFAHYLYAQGYVDTHDLLLKTQAGYTKVKTINYEEGVFTIDAGSYSFASQHIPMTGLERTVLNENFVHDNMELKINCINNGNPHCVIFVDSLSRERTIQLGRMFNANSFFPEGINIQTVELIDRHHVKAEVYERGAGYALSSAASACAISAVTHTLGYTETKINIMMPGGQFSALISDEGHVFLTIKVTAIAQGKLYSSFLDYLETQNHTDPYFSLDSPLNLSQKEELTRGITA